MTIKKITTTIYRDDEEGFTFTFEPADNSLTIKKTDEGYEARYLTRMV